LATSREQAMTDSFRRWNRVLLIVFGVLTIAFLIGPSLLIVPMGFSSAKILSFPPPGFSLQWYEKMVTSPSWTAGFINSFQVAILTAILSSILGTMAALGISRGRFPGKSVANVLILSPLVVPVVVIAIGMFSLYVRWKITGSVVGLVVAHTALAVPFVVVSVTTSLRTMDRNLEMAAANLGASPARTFRHITLPLIMPGVFAGALFAFLSSWDEVVVAIFLTTTKFRTLPTVMWEQVRQVIDPTVASVATVLLAVTTIVLTLALVVRRQAPVR
jgi:putative spermidine/putrescine transport system permease protein